MRLTKWLGLLAIGCLLATSPASAQNTVLTLAPSTTSGITNTTVTVGGVTLLPQPQGGLYGLDVLIKFTAGGTATGTVQLFIEDSADGGVTWDDLIGSNTFALGAGASSQHFYVVAESGVPALVTGAVAANITQGGAPTQEAAAAATARQGPFGDRLRVREKVSGVAGSPVGCVYTITAVVR